MSSEVDELYKLLQKKFKDRGKDIAGVSVHKGGDVNISSYVPYGIPTGIAELDLRMRGGYPAGKIIEIYGRPATGKSTLGLHAVREVQRAGGVACWVDTEKAWDDDRATQLGIDVESLILFDADTVEASFKSLEEYINSLIEINFKKPVIVVVDSATGAPTEAEEKAGYTPEARVGLEAKQIRRGVRMLVNKLAKQKIIVLFINHSVSKINKTGRGKDRQAAGGNALKFWSSVRLELSEVMTLKDSKDKSVRIGKQIAIGLEKLRGTIMREPYIKDLQLLDEGGFDRYNSLLVAGQETGFIERLNLQTYQLGEHQFKKAEMPQLLEQLGGFDAVYKAWKKHAIENGKIIPWGSR